MVALRKPVILLPLHPASLIHLNSQRHQIIPVGHKEGSIDLKTFW